MTTKTYTTTSEFISFCLRGKSDRDEMERQGLEIKLSVKLRGFTLVEILLVVVIIALLSGVGMGIGVGRYKKIQLEKAARDFVLAARYARMAAIEQRIPCIIELDREGSVFAVLTYGVNTETGQTEMIPVLGSYFKKPVEFGGDVRFEEVRIASVGESMVVEEEEEAIVFLPNGTAEAAVVQIGDGKNHYTASICAATGKTRLYSGTADAVGSPTTDLDEY